MREPFVLINDEFFPASEAKLLVSDLAIQRGYGIFDFMKTIDGRVIFASEHLDRFLHSASQLRLPVSKTKEELLALIHALQARNDLPDSGIKITLTGGYSEDGYTLSKPNLIMTQTFLRLPPRSAVEAGIRLVTYPHQRQMPEVKSIDYLMGIWLVPFIKENGAADVLYQHDGVLTECPRANFFLVMDDGRTIVTPAHRILKGIIRSKVISLASAKYSVQEREVTVADLDNAAEAFITSTTKQVMPVVSIDGQVIGKGVPGKVTLGLAEEVEGMVGNQTPFNLSHSE